MERSRHKVRNQVLGPRALAVISCALALLAAQPVMGTPRSQPTSASVKVTGQIAASEAALDLSRHAQNTSIRKQNPREGAITSSRGPAVHILATVEMLSRLLAFELRPMERQVAPALYFAPMAVAVDLVSAPPYRFGAADLNDIQRFSHEQRFAIEQHLLAPPVA